MTGAEMTKTQGTIINETTLQAGVAWLCDRDPGLAAIMNRHGPLTHLWLRPPGFPTLVHIILEQQVSIASAKATFDRLNADLAQQNRVLTSENLLRYHPDQLKRLGFSRQKTRYIQGLALALEEDILDLESLAQHSDDTVRTELCQLKGIGPWTAEIYLMMALGRSDAWPVGDLALQIAAQRLKQLDHRPKGEELVAIAQPWRPWRSVAARILWHDYLNR